MARILKVEWLRVRRKHLREVCVGDTCCGPPLLGNELVRMKMAYTIRNDGHYISCGWRGYGVAKCTT